jgi:hypothetical protein
MPQLIEIDLNEPVKMKAATKEIKCNISNGIIDGSVRNILLQECKITQVDNNTIDVKDLKPIPSDLDVTILDLIYNHAFIVDTLIKYEPFHSEFPMDISTISLQFDTPTPTEPTPQDIDLYYIQLFPLKVKERLIEFNDGTLLSLNQDLYCKYQEAFKWENTLSTYQQAAISEEIDLSGCSKQLPHGDEL